MLNQIKNKWIEIFNGGHSAEVMQGVAWSLTLKIIGSGIGFAFNVAVARLLGVEGAGVFFLALAIVTIGSVVGRLGLDNALLRFVSAGASVRDWERVNGVYALGLQVAILASSAVTVIIFASSSFLANVLFMKPELTETLRWMSFSIVPFTLLNLHAESLKGLKRVGGAMLVQGISLPLLSLAVIYPLVKMGGVSGAAWAYNIAAFVTAVLGLCLWNQATALHKKVSGVFSYKELWNSCKHLAVAAILNRAVLPWAPIFFLGIWASNAEVGIFSVANRTVMLVTLLLFSVNNILAPKFSELYVKNDIVSLERTAQLMAKITLLFTSPIFLVLIFFGKEVMGGFGEAFRSGGIVLTILSIGQLVNVATGSVGVLLVATGNEKSYQQITVYSTFFLIVLSVVMIPLLGAMGAAIAASVAVAVNNISASWMVYSKLKIRVFL